jgi:type I restriction enzyme R subunit
MFVSIDNATGLQMHDKVLTSTDMAPIVSPGQNEVEQMKAMGLDIVPR